MNKGVYFMTLSKTLLFVGNATIFAIACGMVSHHLSNGQKEFSANRDNITVWNGALCIWESDEPELFEQQLVMCEQCRLIMNSS